MKKIIFFTLCFSTALCAENPTLQVPKSSLQEVSTPFAHGDELKALDQLTQATTRQLQMEQQLKNLMLQFRDEQERFAQGEQSKAHAGQMVRTARQIYEILTENHIEHFFPKDYLEELTFFSSIAGKSKISKP
jgi:hypothetical protein